MGVNFIGVRSDALTRAAYFGVIFLMNKTRKQAIFTVLAIISTFVVLYSAYTWNIAQQREKDVLRIIVGMNRDSVEDIVGKEIWKADPKACDCKTNCTQSIYMGNPSIWVKRFEDYLFVCYSNNSVIEVNRVGL